MATAINFKQIRIPENLIDLFGRLRVSSPDTQVQVKQTTPLIDELASEGEVSGSGTISTFPSGSADYTDIGVGGTNVGLRRFRSTIAGLYQNGKPLIIFQTFNFLTSGQANVSKRVGYFDDNNGIYLEQRGTQYYWVLRSNTGAQTEVERSSWDEPLDNPGDPDRYVDLTTGVIAWYSFEYLGQGRVSCGFVINAQLICSHVFEHSNALARPYWQTPNLFLTWEIEKTVAGGTTERFRAICGSVLIEGGGSSAQPSYPIILERTTNFNFGGGTNGDTIAQLAVRLNPNAINSRVLINSFLGAISSNANFIARVFKNPTIPGWTPSWTDFDNRSIQYEILTNNNFQLTDPDNEPNIIAQAYGNVAGDVANGAITEQTFLTTRFDNTPDIFVLTITPFSNNEISNYCLLKLLEEI